MKHKKRSRRRPYRTPEVRVPKQTLTKMHAAEIALKNEIAAHAATRAALSEAIDLISRMVHSYELGRNVWTSEHIQRLEHWRALSVLP